MRRIPSPYLFISTTCMLLLLSSCGYHFESIRGTSEILREKSISIGKFKNGTSYSNLGIILGGKIKKSLIANGFSGNFSPSSQFLIRGTVLSISERPVGFSKERFALEYEVTSSADIEVLRNDTGELVSSFKGVSETTSYYSGTDPSYSRTNRQEAVDALMETMAARFVNLLKEK